MTEALFATKISGRVGIKKNSKRIIPGRGRLFVLPSAKYMIWERMALTHLIKARLETLLGPLSAHLIFNFKSRLHEADIDNCIGGPLDVLQKAGIILNDKQVLQVVAEKRFGAEESIEITLSRFLEVRKNG